VGAERTRHKEELWAKQEEDDKTMWLLCAELNTDTSLLLPQPFAKKTQIRSFEVPFRLPHPLLLRLGNLFKGG